MWCIVTVAFLRRVQIFLVRIFVLIKIILYTVIHPGYFLFFFVIKFGKISMEVFANRNINESNATYGTCLT